MTMKGKARVDLVRWRHLSSDPSFSEVEEMRVIVAESSVDINRKDRAFSTFLHLQASNSSIASKKAWCVSCDLSHLP